MSNAQAMFPDGPVGLDGIANARLRRVRRAGGCWLGVYELVPLHRVNYLSRVGSLSRAQLGRRYEPLPGRWSSLVISDREEEHQLLVGVSEPVMRAMASSCQDLGVKAGSVVSELLVRRLGLGYLDMLEV